LVLIVIWSPRGNLCSDLRTHVGDMSSTQLGDAAP